MSHLIKMYHNRKFFSLENHKYVTLTEILGMYREGEKLEVRNSQNEDITTDTIINSIVKSEHDKPRFRKHLLNYARNL